MRIVFMGTPEFAVDSLKMLIDSGFNVVGVVTMPDKPAGRGYKLQYSAVKQYAVENHLTLLQPHKLKDENFLFELKKLRADLQIVVAFRMLPEVVWNMPRLGTFNLHASLLPEYRGAAPINWAIINGEKVTGVTTFFLTDTIDTGKIILQEKITIEDTDDAGKLHDKLKILGAHIVKKSVELIATGEYETIEQSDLVDESTVLNTAPKIFKHMCQINVMQNVTEVHNFVRGLSPYPAAWCVLQLPGKAERITCKIFLSRQEYCRHFDSPGTLLTDKKKYLKIAVKDGYIHLLEIQTPGRKKMRIESFLAGLK